MFGLRDVSDFHFAWPAVLLLLLLIPLGWVIYLRRERELIRKRALHFSYAVVAEQLNLRPAAWKRLLAPITVSLAVAALVVGLARPTVVAEVPVNSVDMMLVLDISLSMMAKDIKPDRIAAAREAAADFVDSLPRDARIGLEVFAGGSYVLSPPTSRHGEIMAYLRALRPEDLRPRTEIGNALHTALKVLNAQAGQQPSKGGQSGKIPDRVIVLLSDGDSHEGYPWDQAARDARQAHVSIFTVGIGSLEGATITYQGMELPVTFSEQTLRDIAEIAGGRYFRVFNEADFRRVYEQIREKAVHYEQQSVDLAFLAAGFALSLVLAAMLLLMLI